MPPVTTTESTTTAAAIKTSYNSVITGFIEAKIEDMNQMYSLNDQKNYAYHIVVRVRTTTTQDYLTKQADGRYPNAPTITEKYIAFEMNKDMDTDYLLQLQLTMVRHLRNRRNTIQVEARRNITFKETVEKLWSTMHLKIINLTAVHRPAIRTLQDDGAPCFLYFMSY